MTLRPDITAARPRGSARAAGLDVADCPTALLSAEGRDRGVDPRLLHDPGGSIRPAHRPLRPLRGLHRPARGGEVVATLHQRLRVSRGPQHIFGLDGNVRDFFSRVVYAARVSLTLGFTTVLITMVIGAVIGAIAGYAGGWSDNVMMRIMDVVLGFPSLILAIAIVFVLGPGLRNTLLAIAIVTIPQYARVMRASVLSIKEVDYVSASRALGASRRKSRHPGRPQCPDAARRARHAGHRHRDP